MSNLAHLPHPAAVPSLLEVSLFEVPNIKPRNAGPTRALRTVFRITRITQNRYLPRPRQLANTMWNQSLQLHSPCQLMTREFKFETPQCQHVRQVALPSEVNRANSLGFQPMHTSISMKDGLHVIALYNLICIWRRHSIETIAATDGKRSFMATAANS